MFMPLSSATVSCVMRASWAISNSIACASAARSSLSGSDLLLGGIGDGTRHPVKARQDIYRVLLAQTVVVVHSLGVYFCGPTATTGSAHPRPSGSRATRATSSQHPQPG